MSRNGRMTPTDEKKIVICISGMAGTGKSTLAKKLAQKYKLKYYSGGDALRELAKEEGCNSFTRGWWESPEGLSFLKKRESNTQFDKIVDDKLLKYAEQGNVILDSWAMPWLLQTGFKIWLAASEEKRARRIAKRDGISLEKAMQVLREKEARTKAIYEKLYGFRLGEDFEPFHLILDTDNLDANEVFQVLCMVMDNIILKNANM
ncbi:MAG: cytidylate kinase family protein [Candidatus Bathyarchaeota archaeon]|nr:cytidylate kinase family protein [Candidatus Bathyarchaeota archaeon]